MTCDCNKTKEISTSNSADIPPLKIDGLDLTEKIDVTYLNTDSTKFPNDELERVDGEPYPTHQYIPQEPYGQEPPHEPYLSEFVPCDDYCHVQKQWTTSIASKIISREHALLDQDIPEDKVHDMLVEEFGDIKVNETKEYESTQVKKLNINESVAISGDLSNQKVGENVINFTEPYSVPYEGDDENWLGTASKVNSEPSMHGEEGWAGSRSEERGYENHGKQDKIFELPPHYTQETEKPRWAVYKRTPHQFDVLCEAFDGKEVDLSIDSFRPIPPSEDAEFTNTAVNCKCYWILIEDTKPDIEEKEQPRDDITKQFIKAPDPHDPYKEAILQVNVPASNLSRYGKYTRTSTEPCKICDMFKGKTYDLAKKQRPVPPSEGKGYTNTHPNCHCYFEPVDNPEEETNKMAVPTKLDVLDAIQKKHIFSVHRKIGQRAKNKKLHTVFQDGKLSKRTRGTNPMKEIKETLVELHGQFNWFTPDYLAKIAELDKSVGGKFILVRASAETITDHRAEGEPHRRLLKGEELMQLTRTGIGKSTDINHLGTEYKVDSQVLDAEYDPIRKESQMLVHLKDPEIIKFIETGQIASVSINAGAPRRMDTECDSSECFVVPTGLILGELDGIAFTFVVDDPAGIVWRGKYIPKATAGVKVTKIEIID